jgi:hypothetical protein
MAPAGCRHDKIINPPIAKGHIIMKHEFTGSNLNTVMKRAAGRSIYLDKIKCERLYSEVSRVNSRLTSLIREIESVQRDIEDLEWSRNVDVGRAVIVTAVGITAGHVRTAIAAALTARRVISGRLSPSAINAASLIPAVAALSDAALSLANAARAHSRIQDTVHKLENLRRQADTLNQDWHNSFRRLLDAGCLT